jgi:hypothetical protein
VSLHASMLVVLVPSISDDCVTYHLKWEKVVEPVTVHVVVSVVPKAAARMEKTSCII